MPFLSFSNNFLQDSRIIFQKSVDNFEIGLKTCSLLVWGCISPLKVTIYADFCLLIRWVKTKDIGQTSQTYGHFVWYGVQFKVLRLFPWLSLKSSVFAECSPCVTCIYCSLSMILNMHKKLQNTQMCCRYRWILFVFTPMCVFGRHPFWKYVFMFYSKFAYIQLIFWTF